MTLLNTCQEGIKNYIKNKNFQQFPSRDSHFPTQNFTKEHSCFQKFIVLAKQPTYQYKWHVTYFKEKKKTTGSYNKKL